MRYFIKRNGINFIHSAYKFVSYQHWNLLELKAYLTMEAID